MVAVTDPYSIVGLTPLKEDGQELSVVRSFLQSLDHGDTASLEIAVMDGEVVLMLRSRWRSEVRQRLISQYDGYDLWQIRSDMDPMFPETGEQTWTLNIGRDLDLTHKLASPAWPTTDDALVGVIGAMSQARPGERVICRIVIRKTDPEALLRNAGKGRSQHGVGSLVRDVLLDGRMVLALTGAGALALGKANPELVDALRLYVVHQDSSGLQALAGATLPWGVPALLGAGAAFLGFRKWTSSRGSGGATFDFSDPARVADRYSLGCFDAQVQIHAILPDNPNGEMRAGNLLPRVAGAYRPLMPGGWLSRVNLRKRVTRACPSDLLSLPGDRRWWQERYLKDVTPIGPDEAALLNHPLHPRDDPTDRMERRQHRLLASRHDAVSHGAPYGITTGDRSPRLAHISEDTRRGHMIALGATRQGKSTFILHNIIHEMRRKARGLDSAAIVVVDPHTQMVKDLMERVPYGIRDRVRLLDLADKEGMPGINVLDVRTFPDRDRTCSDISKVAKGLWPDEWGPRMQELFENAYKALHEANSRPGRSEAQYTLLDAALILQHEAFRREVLPLVSDKTIKDWWREFDLMSDRDRRERTSALRSRIAFFAQSERARAIFGQSSTTFDFAKMIADGDVVLISTAQGSVGHDVAALVGGALLNVVNRVVVSQEGLPPDQLQRVMLAIDELQSIPGVDYSAMGGETAKYGCSLLLATQSLAKLDDLEPPMSETILGNMGAVCAFRTSPTDARPLVIELGSGLDYQDLTSIDPYNAFVRVTSNGRRYPAYSVKMLPLVRGSARMAAYVRRSNRRYTTPIADVERLIDARVSRYIAGGLSKLGGYLADDD